MKLVMAKGNYSSQLKHSLSKRKTCHFQIIVIPLHLPMTSDISSYRRLSAYVLSLLILPLHSLLLTPFDKFKVMNEEDVKHLITKSGKKSCALDPMPTSLVIECLEVLCPVITRLINLSLDSGLFPDNWKHAEVRPSVKNNFSFDPSFPNLRPTSNLTFISKLTERAVSDQTHKHLSVHNLYPKNQSAYREFHSTEMALLRIIKHDILMKMSQQHVTLLVTLDLSAAFDTIDHVILLKRLHSNFGISGRVISWFQSYLENRSQSISVNGATSKRFHLQHGVPQGSCLGPVLFLMYASGLFNVIEPHLPEAHMLSQMIPNSMFHSNLTKMQTKLLQS